ncbi:hypothetical protein [Paracidovorax avenae]|uniref:hypothetical protein n=1 Tax=Paracidovorax avenae TaxID=80867 RepID=UPI001AD80D92|nr:hypothetical protein [Paracidovorax avenae]
MMENNLLLDIPEFKEMLTDCEVTFRDKVAELSINGFVESFLLKPNEWKYSRGDFFNPLPYREEMAGYQPAKLLKKSYSSTDEASEKGIYSSGFIDGNHVVTRHPLELKNVMDICFFERRKDEVSCFNIRGFRSDSGRKDIIKSVEKIVDKGNKILSAIYAGDGNFSLNLLLKNTNGELNEEYVYAKDWSKNDIYKYIHHEGRLIEVRGVGKTGDFDVLLWQRKS